MYAGDVTADETLSASATTWNCRHTYTIVLIARCTRGTTTAEKLRGKKVWIPTPGRLCPVPSQRPGWVLGAGGGRPLPLWGSGGIIPGKFLIALSRCYHL